MANVRQGLTIIELLVVIAVLGVLLSVSVTFINPPNTRVFAGEVKAAASQSRYEAVKRNRPVAFTWDSDAREFVTRFDDASRQVPDTCDGDTVLTTKSATQYRSMAVTTDMIGGGIVWLPSGQGRTCNGAPISGNTIDISDGSNSRSVTIAAGGKVSIE